MNYSDKTTFSIGSHFYFFISPQQMDFSPEPSIFEEHQQWKNIYSPIVVNNKSNNLLFSNFGTTFQNSSTIHEFNFDIFIDSVSKQLSNDIFHNLLKMVYTDSIYRSLQLNPNIPAHIEKEEHNLRKTKSLTSIKLDNILNESNDFLDLDQVDCCIFDDLDDSETDNRIFNTIS